MNSRHVYFPALLITSLVFQKANADTNQAPTIDIDGSIIYQHRAPSDRLLNIDSILIETIDLKRTEVGIGDQYARLHKICLDGHAYFLFGGSPITNSRTLNSFAPAFKEGKPEVCNKNK